MNLKGKGCRGRAIVCRAAVVVVASGAIAQTVRADVFNPNDIVLSRVEYTGDPTQFNDPNFPGIQGEVFLDQYDPITHQVTQVLALPASNSQNTGITSSFSSKSEGALTRSVDGQYLTYIGYQAAIGAVGVSNSYTPDAYPSTATGAAYNRIIARISSTGAVNDSTVLGNAYSGDNPRAVQSVDGTQFYSVGNSDKTPPADQSTGARYVTLGASLDSSIKLGSQSTNSKYDNYRGVQIFNNTLYVAKGSGSNGNDGIFQVGSAGSLPTTTGQTITALPGVSFSASSSPIHPFGFFFANASTLYVADEGDGTTNANSYAGLEKWSLAGGQWTLDYTLQNGLDLDVLKTVNGYSAQTATVGLRNLAGIVNGDQVTLYAITAQDSSISGGEPDPTNLVAITDSLSATTLPNSESFSTLANSAPGEVFRGVSLAPVPEPTSAAILGVGALALLARRRRS